MAGKRTVSRQATHVLSTQTGQWIVRRNGRVRSRHDRRDDALAAAKALGGGGRLVVHDELDRRGLAVPLGLLVGEIDFGEGTRTTLRVPDAVADAARMLAEEVGTSKNDAIVRLALAGARVVERAREVAEKREARWQALLARDIAGHELPDPDEMRAASFALRGSGE